MWLILTPIVGSFLILLPVPAQTEELATANCGAGAGDTDPRAVFDLRDSAAIPMAEKLLAKRLARSPDTAGYLYNVAILYYATDAYAQAEPLFQGVVAYTNIRRQRLKVKIRQNVENTVRPT